MEIEKVLFLMKPLSFQYCKKCISANIISFLKWDVLKKKINIEMHGTLSYKQMSCS